MQALVECQGVPRDLGVAQGRACAQAIRESVAAHGWRARLRGPARAEAELARELRRHHPQLAERIEGIARGAGVPTRALVRALEADGDAAPALALAGREGGALVGRLLAPAAGLVWRCSRPEAGIASLELVRPGLAAAAAGVNEAGLALAASGFARVRGGSPVPAAVLVQDCLQRFATAEAAVEWCLKRPAGGRGAIVAADAAGRVGGVLFADAGAQGATRRVLASEDGVLAAGGDEAACVAAAKACREAPRGREALRGALAAAAPGWSAVWLDPVARRIWLAPAQADEPLCERELASTPR